MNTQHMPLFFLPKYIRLTCGFVYNWSGPLTAHVFHSLQCFAVFPNLSNDLNFEYGTVFFFTWYLLALAKGIDSVLIKSMSAKFPIVCLTGTYTKTFSNLQLYSLVLPPTRYSQPSTSFSGHRLCLQFETSSRVLQSSLG